MYKDKELSTDEQGMLTSVFWRQNLLMIGINHTRMQGLGYAWIIKPMLKEIYQNKEDYFSALKRNSAFFNTTPQMASFILGLTLSMEKEKAVNPEFDEESINAVKVGLMGPFAGLGDSFFAGTLRVIATGIGLGLAQAGNILGPILFLLVYNIPSYLIRYYGTKLGYMLGSKYIQEATESGLLASVTKAASIMGLIMVGAMTFQMVNFTTTFQTQLGGQVFVLQKVLDSICLGILPLSIVLICYELLRKKVNPVHILIGIVCFAFLAVITGFAGTN